nr:MAG TPA: hypothetical protein [Caudoviricetes sp.]
MTLRKVYAIIKTVKEINKTPERGYQYGNR